MNGPTRPLGPAPAKPRRPALAWVAMVAAIAAGTCTPVALRPRGEEHTGAYRGLFNAAFDVACDSCFVEYGPEGNTTRRVVEGGWSGYVSLGTVRAGQQVHLLLRADPYGKTRVQSARIEVDGRTVASGEGKKPGSGVYLSARVGPGSASGGRSGPA